MGRRRLGMADVTGGPDVITYREAVAEGLTRELRRDPSVVCLGEDIGAAGGVFKTTSGLFAEFGRERVWDTPISEQAILGVAMGAAMTGMRPVAEIMFSDFFACCWDYLANEIPKMRYMTGGQVTVPLVVRTANGGGLGFGAQHSQAVENWTLTIPGLKIAAPSTPADVIGMLAAAIRSDDPVVFFEHKGLFASKGPAAPDGHVVEFGHASVVRAGSDVSLPGRAGSSRARRPGGSPSPGRSWRKGILQVMVVISPSHAIPAAAAGQQVRRYRDVQYRRSDAGRPREAGR